ncbi:TetR/AcrR family transcriptional regulator [Priestia megaterium]|uniref:TetR/AcrR family transcriptional regulator n=1 Tax=Priestia megaterium TaxID=1404 RepID=UPI000680DF31|nr:TetR/AcrR family transcriptional regulator [Priestia megaterium]KNH16686.1 TetR family transcriptional regulator [Priestia megaterium]PAK43082.1 TetR/AcrR family transcriptional regulator [Priestia megaterium]
MPQGIRQHKKTSRYESIIYTAEHLFLESGIDAVQMQDIAKAEGIGIATLFRYFPKKEKLIVAVAIKNLERTLAQLNTIVQSPKTAYERLEDTLNYLLTNQTREKNSAKFREAFESYASIAKEPLTDIELYIDIQKEITMALLPIIEDGKSDGSLRTDIPIKETVITLINTYGTFGNNVLLKSPITYTEDDFLPEVQLRILKDIFLSYVNPRYWS